jgi:nucleotide-binding universal stress UspA family protein
MLQQFRRVLCPVDFSTRSAMAVKTAAHIVALSKGKLGLVHIVTDPWSGEYKLDPNIPVRLEMQDAQKRAEEMLKDFAAAHAPGVSCEFFVRSDLYAEKWIGKSAISFGADLIVMSISGDSLLSRVAEGVIRLTPCSVLLVRSAEMDKKNPLKDKLILVVDDEPDVLEAVADLLPMSLVHKAKDYETAARYLKRYTYDIVILDIMGVNGFELLKQSVEEGYPTIMLSAHEVTPEAMEKSMKLGALFFLPKEKMSELDGFLEEVLLGEGQPLWTKLLIRLGSYFDRVFGPDWKDRQEILKQLEKELKGK